MGQMLADAIAVTPQPSGFGALITGVDLSAPLAPETLKQAAIRAR